MKQYKRSSRISEQVLRDISQLMETELVDEAPGMITFTHVRISDDLRYAKVYYSCLGQDEEQRKAADFLEKEKKRIRHLIGRNLRLKHVPEFTFKFDRSVQDGIRIEQLLDEIKNRPNE
ncbi:MAG: 30S ribosome-binding factor RbfA [Candidatus Zixiibacteriota bacterium]|nr:MAG: 30S ribosome-binding factor RbfA [candidate division Zixibacteria bacterium]